MITLARNRVEPDVEKQNRAHSAVAKNISIYQINPTKNPEVCDRSQDLRRDQTPVGTSPQKLFGRGGSRPHGRHGVGADGRSPYVAQVLF